jgi:hypothetical protein
MALTETEEKILRSIYDLHYLTVNQLTLLHYKQATSSMLNYVAAICKRLDEEHEHYLQRGYLACAVSFGRNPLVFRLSHNNSSPFSPPRRLPPLLICPAAQLPQSPNRCTLGYTCARSMPGSHRKAICN